MRGGGVGGTHVVEIITPRKTLFYQMNHPVFQLVFSLVFFYAYTCICKRVCVDRRFTSHRGLHFPANRFNFTFSIELEFSFTLFPSLSLSISQFLFVCVRRVFRSLFRLHIHGNGSNTHTLTHIHNRGRIN